VTRVLTSLQATTNKTSWPNVIGFGPNTTWIPHARWVEDTSREPPIWSSSGVTSGFDLTFHFVQVYFGEEQAALVSKLIEYVRHTDPNDDPFARNDTIIVPQ
jgi:transcriptional regulator GlxA family with amidase domain